MKIELQMLDFWKLSATLQEKVIGRYLEYPKNNKVTEFVIQRHEIGDAQHFDWRNAIDNYLIGWSIVGFSKDKPADIRVWLQNIGKGFRAETKCWSNICNEWKYDVYEKDNEYYFVPAITPHLLNIEDLARQPKVWLFKKMPTGKRFTFKPGEVGAGIEKPGYMTVLTRGKVKFGTQKVWFHEYFLKDNRYFKDWTRIVVRAVRVPRLDPETKKPIPGKFERFWRFMIPKEQIPYAITKRAIEEKWKPPKGIIPFPEEWAKKNFPEQYKKWLEYMGKSKEELSKKINYTLSMHKYRGPIHIRGMWRIEWYLFLDDMGKGKIRTFNLKGDPMREEMIETWYEGRDSRKYLTWEGRTKPMSRFNPNKKLHGDMKILESGTCEYESKIIEGEEKVTVKFKGKILKGNWILEQEEKGSASYVFYKEGKLALTGEQYEFGYYRHYWNNKEHFDLRWKTSDTTKEEFNLYGDILTVEIEEPIQAVHKKFIEPKEVVDYWMIKEGKKVKRRIGKLETFVDVIDYGKLTIIERNPQFISFMLRGKKFKDVYLTAKKDKTWVIMKSKLPRALLAREGDPRTGKYYTPFQVESKRTWDYFIVHLYDIREFTRCEPGEKVKEYLDIEIPTGVNVGICLYPRPGKIHGARVSYIKFNKDTWTEDKAIAWIKQNKLEKWSGIQIRKVKELSYDSYWMKARIDKLDLPGREIHLTVLSPEGERRMITRIYSDALMLRILNAYRRGRNIFYFRIYGGNITQFLTPGEYGAEE